MAKHGPSFVAQSNDVTLVTWVPPVFLASAIYRESNGYYRYGEPVTFETVRYPTWFLLSDGRIGTALDPNRPEPLFAQTVAEHNARIFFTP